MLKLTFCIWGSLYYSNIWSPIILFQEPDSQLNGVCLTYLNTLLHSAYSANRKHRLMGDVLYPSLQMLSHRLASNLPLFYHYTHSLIPSAKKIFGSELHLPNQSKSHLNFSDISRACSKFQSNRSPYSNSRNVEPIFAPFFPVEYLYI